MGLQKKKYSFKIHMQDACSTGISASVGFPVGDIVVGFKIPVLIQILLSSLAIGARLAFLSEEHIQTQISVCSYKLSFCVKTKHR